VDDVDLKTMLDERAEDMRLDPRIPGSILRRARRRRATTAVLAGAVTVGLAVGAFVGARSLLAGTASAPPEVRPGTGTTEEFYPFIYPPTAEQLEVTQEQVAQGSMPLWTEPEGVAILFAVNVMGWDMEDVEVDVQGETATIRNPTLPEGSRLKQPVATTLHLFEVPDSDPPIYAVLAAQAEGLEIEPLGPDDEFGASGRIGFRGSLGFVPEGAQVALTVDRGDAIIVPAPDGVFEIETEVSEPVGTSTLISLAVLDGSRNMIALTSSRIATPVVGATESGASEPKLAIPGSVAETREAILAAAQAQDWEALRALIPDEGFTFSFSGESDPIRYWKRLESEGHVPVIGDILPAVLGTEPGFQRGVFVWPAQATEEPARWDEADIEALTAIHAEEDVRGFQEAGLYYGWRVGIDRDGTWMFFVSGD
jgi:hypothetical protein